MAPHLRFYMASDMHAIAATAGMRAMGIDEESEDHTRHQSSFDCGVQVC